MANVIRVLIVALDPERLARIREALDAHEDVEIVGEVSSLGDAMRFGEGFSLDLVIVTGALRRRAWRRFARWMEERWPDVRVLWMEEPEPSIAEAIQAGISGYLVKEVGSDELANAARLALEGRPLKRLDARDPDPPQST